MAGSRTAPGWTHVGGPGATPNQRAAATLDGVVWRRDTSAELRRLYREHVDAVYAFFAYHVSRPFAEDLTSATFERVVRAWGSYDRRLASERTWILTIARNLLTDHFRRQVHRDMVSTDEFPGLVNTALAPDDGLEDVLSADAVRSMLAPLDERERAVVALRYGADLSAIEVAAVLDLTPANVHQIASRALRRLRAGEQALSRSA
jgi:RNA polymerase sigma-70 factor (ECF subfamily)